MNSKVVVLVLFISLWNIKAFGQEFPVASIPESLKENADVVVRESSNELRIISEKEAVLSIKKAYTILNKKGEDYAVLVIPYDQDRSVKNIRAYSLNANGQKNKSIKKTDIIDQSYSGGSFVTDSRLKAADLTQNSFPYTVVYEYQIRYTSLFYFPDWFPLEGENVSVEKAQYSVVFPDYLKPKFYEQNIKGELLDPSKHNGFFDEIRWKAANLQAVESQSLSPDLYELFPLVKVAPSAFKTGGYEGSLNSWLDFGDWFYALNKGRDALSENTKAKITNLVKDAKSDKEKIKIIYQYLQENTRYVSIQLGIGGFQTYEANFVEENKWGDCKALTNYTKAMLKSVGIESNFALVNAGYGSEKVIESFPSNQFNHVILSIPQKSDTLWLECTSSNGPFGFLGSFTAGKNVLFIKKGGSQIVQTPSYSHKQNRATRIARTKLDIDGNAFSKVASSYFGLEYEDKGFDFELYNSKEEQKKWLLEKLEINNVNINTFSLSREGDEAPVGKENLELTIPKFAKVTGKRVYFEPNMYNKIAWTPPKTKEREYDIVLKYAWTNVDENTFELPESLQAEFIPETIAFESIFGTYKATFTPEDGTIKYKREVTIYKGTYSKYEYKALLEFYKKIKKADKSKVVFLTKT